MPVVGGVDCFEKADGWDVLIPPNTEDVVVLGVPELKLANGEAEVADVPPNTELEAIKEKNREIKIMKKIRQNKILQKLPVAVVGGAVKADVEVAELDPKIEPVDAGVLAKTDEGLDTFAATELVAKGFETAAVVIIGIGLL